jgi:excisionase family DNA binding protein
MVTTGKLCDASQWSVLMTVPQAAEFAQVGRAAMYAMCRIPGFPVWKHGKKFLIPRDAFLRWIEDQVS